VGFLLGLCATLLWHKIAHTRNTSQSNDDLLASIKEEINKTDASLDKLYKKLGFTVNEVEPRGGVEIASYVKSSWLSKVSHPKVPSNYLDGIKKSIQALHGRIHALVVNNVPTKSESSDISRRRGGSLPLRYDERPLQSEHWWEPPDQLPWAVMHQHQPATPALHLSSKVSEATSTYNRAQQDDFAREQFRENFTPLRLGTANAVQRRQDPNLAPEFRQANDGDFFAIKGESLGCYEVFPRFGLVIKDSSFNAGAIKEVFNCPNYNPHYSYANFKVQHPAVFRQDGATWQLITPGALELGQGE
jgi:hypothetical protein